MADDESGAMALAPEEFVQAIYQAFLGRPADADGLAYWTRIIRKTGDPTRVVVAIQQSEEYRMPLAAARPPDCRAEIGQAMAALRRRPRIVDIGAQSLGAGTHPYDGLLQLGPVEIIGFDPLTERLQERAAAEAAEGLTLLPYAIGDGTAATLHVNNDDATSSLFPLNEPHNILFNHLSMLRTVRAEPLETRRLDDVLPVGPVDYLKLDVQGAELMVLQGATRSLVRTAVIHCEVEFSPIYAGQPLYPEIHQFLTEHGFALIDLPTQSRYHYLTPSGRTTPDRLIWADAVFFRETDDPEMLVAQALVAAAIYRKPTLAEHLLGRAGVGTRSA